MNTRQKWLAAILLATLAAVFWPQVQNSDEDVVAAVRRPTAQPEQAAMLVSVQTLQENGHADEVRLSGMQTNLFPSQTWAPPPPPPKPQVVLPPQPPPLPFSFLGRWMDGGKETVFLMQGDRPLPINVGQVISGSWRVDEIERGKVVFTYLPLDMQSTLGLTP